MVPNLVTGVWVGAEDRAIHFEDIAYGLASVNGFTHMGSIYEKCLSRFNFNDF